jgi:hypothetical protein
MDMIPLKPERRAQLEEYAKRRGLDPATALDDALATYLEWERQDFAEAVEGVRPRLRRCKSRAHQARRVSRGPAPEAWPSGYVDPCPPDACAFI